MFLDDCLYVLYIVPFPRKVGDCAHSLWSYINFFKSQKNIKWKPSLKDFD